MNEERLESIGATEARAEADEIIPTPSEDTLILGDVARDESIADEDDGDDALTDNVEVVESPEAPISPAPDTPSDEESDDLADGTGTPDGSAPSADTVTEPVPDTNRPRRIDGIFDFIELFVFTMVTVLILTTFFFRYSVVDGGSMLNTLSDNDKLLISDLFYTPTQGDVIVLEDYTTDLKKPLVKRVIATEGQRVRISYDGVYVDGVLLDEPYVFIDDPSYVYNLTPRAALFDNPSLEYVPGEYYELVVPRDELFVMGDHRNKSTDSRDIGTVREDSVLGRVILRLYPFEEFGFFD